MRPIAGPSTCNWPPSVTSKTRNDTGLGYQSDCNHSHGVYPTPSGKRSSTFRWKRSLSIVRRRTGPARGSSSTKRNARLQYFWPRAAFRPDYTGRKRTTQVGQLLLSAHKDCEDVYSMKTDCNLRHKRRHTNRARRIFPYATISTLDTSYRFEIVEDLNSSSGWTVEGHGRGGGGCDTRLSASKSRNYD